jgi:hypothetical protein
LSCIGFQYKTCPLLQCTAYPHTQNQFMPQWKAAVLCCTYIHQPRRPMHAMQFTLLLVRLLLIRANCQLAHTSTKSQLWVGGQWVNCPRQQNEKFK